MMLIRKSQVAVAGLALTLGLVVFAAGPARFPEAAEAQSSSLSVTKSIIGSTGGSLSSGRWTARVQAGAYVGVGLVSLRVANPGATSCNLEILPAALNAFAVPVTLTAQFPPGTNLTDYAIERFEPATGRWVVVPGSRADSPSGRVSAPLYHFSTYRVQGKSGW